jgi:CubicO group peptidase (beta-lactamase class C family)
MSIYQYSIKARWLVLAVVCMLAPHCSRNSNLQDLSDYIRFKLERDHMPGMAVVVVKGDEVVWAKGYGLADIHRNLPVTPQTIFGTASITKSLTAAAVFQLQERGMLDIRDPVNMYLPFEVRSSWHPEAVITIDQILAHTSGISNGPALWRIIGCGDSPISLEEWAYGYFLPEGRYWHPEGNFERWAPGEGFQYSNGGYGLLAYLVERVSGVPFADYCEEHFLRPLKMNTASFWVTDLDTTLLTKMYEWGELWGFAYELVPAWVDTSHGGIAGRYAPLCAFGSPTLGDGGLYCSGLELANFLIMVKNGGMFEGQQILSEKSVDRMFSSYVNRELLPPWFVDLGMGGYAMALDNGEAVWGHTGADPGMSTIMFFNREADLGVIVLANRFVDIRDMISWSFAEAFKEFGDAAVWQNNPAWREYAGRSPEGREEPRSVTVRVIPEVLPEGETIYINGNHRRIGGWITRGMPLTRSEDGIWERTFTLYDSTRLSFRITRGSGGTVEYTKEGVRPDRHRFTVVGDTTLTYTVEAWRDMFPK